MSASGVEIGGRFARLYRLLDWPLRLLGLNLLWMVGVLAGGVLAGVSPASVALFAVLREYLLGRPVRPWRDFWGHWRAEFVRAQLRLGVPLLTLWVAAFYLAMARGTPVAVPVAVLGALYLAALAYLPGVLVHFDLSAAKSWRLAAVAAWRSPLWTVGLGLTVAALLVVMVLVAPIAIPFFLPSVPAVLAMLVSLRVFTALAGPVR
ncbi:hypothetical protein GCM10023322_28820 [Rugosimonospora acidiphila]|uniref:Membrane protein YesL n=1 Tax=Rugosimonospora acidiphila TaxID=556531 RepID=A0ABP9RR74_9ACTN